MSSSASSSSSDSDALSTSQSMSREYSQAYVDDSDRDADSDSSRDAEEPSDSEPDEPHEASPLEETLVLSHAERRRQKKQGKKAAEQSQVETAQTRLGKVKNTAELKPSKVPQRQNSVWVGNLSFKTTPDSLRKFFDGVGEITRIHMPMKLASSGPGGRGAVKENQGSVISTHCRHSIHRQHNDKVNSFAYVDFATSDAKTIAITLSENPLDGRRLLIKDGLCSPTVDPYSNLSRICR